ncbi:MAG: hypothetical protein IPG92_19020 [Flavobacteriales bacterium]|nr:hypothetical protein [Flavobacteriales bacterium]
MSSPASTNAIGATITILASDLPYDSGSCATFNAYTWSTGATSPHHPWITAGGSYSCDVLDAELLQLSTSPWWWTSTTNVAEALRRSLSCSSRTGQRPVERVRTGRGAAL